MRKPRPTLVAPLCLATAAPRPAPAEQAPLIGFGVEAAREQRALEARFDAIVRRSDIYDWVRQLAHRPHHVGSPHGKANAEWMASLLRFWGYETKIESYQVLFPTPKTRALEMLAPHAYRASLVDPVLAEDATSGQAVEQLPTYNAYSIDEILVKGQPYTITWNTRNITGTIQIELYRGPVSAPQPLRVIAAAARNSGSYQFTPSFDIPNGSDYLIRISAQSGSLQDFSRGLFTITDTPPRTANPTPWNQLLLLNK